MELKTLFIGIVFAMGIFAVKSGVGIHYLLTQAGERKNRFTRLSLYSLVYLFLFLACAYVIDRIDIIAYFETLQKFIKYGMILHVLMAGGLLIWGILLLRNSGMPSKGKNAWVALIVPCPVCISVVFLSLSFLISYFPNAVHVAAISTYLAFMAIVLITHTAMAFRRNNSKEAPELTVGTAMVLIAVYFFLSIIILPQFGNVDRIYRLAAYEGETQTVGSKDLLLMCSIIIAFLALGFIKMKKQLKGRPKWI
jgi:predicted transporter